MFALAPPVTAAQVTFLRLKKDEADTELIHPGPKTHTYTNKHPACNNTPFACASRSLARSPTAALKWRNGHCVHFPNKSQWFLQANGCGLLTWTRGAADSYPCWCHCLRFGIYAWVSPHKHMLNIQTACTYRELTALIILFLWMTPQCLTADKYISGAASFHNE